jgi:hypothetical protein
MKANTPDGYVSVEYKGHWLKVHRVIYALHHGEMPTNLVIDHINGDKTDNRIENIRCTTIRRNTGNQRTHRKGKLVGAVKMEDEIRWEARIEVNGKQRGVGIFGTEQEAHDRYMECVSLLERGREDEVYSERSIRLRGRKRGVSFDKSMGKWKAYKGSGKKRVTVGWFITEEEAGKALDEWIDNIGKYCKLSEL